MANSSEREMVCNNDENKGDNIKTFKKSFLKQSF